MSALDQYIGQSIFLYEPNNIVSSIMELIVVIVVLFQKELKQNLWFFGAQRKQSSKDLDFVLIEVAEKAVVEIVRGVRLLLT